MGEGSDGVVGYAVVGLGSISQAAVLPAFANAGRNTRLVALVSGDEAKRHALAARYGLAGADTYAYDDFETCLARDDVDAVYIALPNHLHHEYTVRAAAMGVHVLCEKPLAVTVAEAESMIGACREADVRLMVAYRLHLDAGTLHVVERVKAGAIGNPRFFSSTFSLQVAPGDVRVIPAERGGGPLHDLGVYCINAARYLFRAEPEAAWATRASRPEPRFADTDEMMACTLRFPGHRLATFTCSFGAHTANTLQLVGESGVLRVDNAYHFLGPRTVQLDRAEDGDAAGEAGGRDEAGGRGAGARVRRFEPTDQFGAQLLYFSDCVLEGRRPEPDGEEGLLDVRIVAGLLEAAESGRMVELALRRDRRPEPEMALACPAIEPPPPVGGDAAEG